MAQEAIQTPGTKVTCQQQKEKGQGRRSLRGTLLEGTGYLPSPVLLGLYSLGQRLFLASDGQNMESSYSVGMPKWRLKVESSNEEGGEDTGLCRVSYS